MASSGRPGIGSCLAAALFCATAVIVLHQLRQRKQRKQNLKTSTPKQPSPKRAGKKKPKVEENDESTPIPVTLLYGTTTGTARRLAHQLARDIFALNVSGYALKPKAVDMSTYDFETLEQESTVIMIIGTDEGGKYPVSALSFCTTLEEAANDFRVSKAHLNHVPTAIFGLGSTAYSQDLFCAPARKLAEAAASIGAPFLVDAGEGDDTCDVEDQFRQWSQGVLAALCGGGSAVQKDGKAQKGGAKRGVPRPPQAPAPEPELVEEDLINDQFIEAGEEKSGMLDMEDLGTAMNNGKDVSEGKAPAVAREMVTPMQRKALTKEGYKIIGSHSAVKLCRWTKAQLRGRGGCYKHTFYGITSYQCMETTPSLACANKCTFCWRHHKNPVGKEWRWKIDEPVMIVQEAIRLHQKMISDFRAVPGVLPERWQEAMTVAHCALSLVGEPIMYPHINELVRELHSRKISTFLVTNAQFPECIERLVPVTQLYVSIDAATKETLKAVDRPLFADFWERFIGSLRALKHKGQRTVYRLTLVKGWNMEEINNYAELVQVGCPELIEIKAYTFCGVSDGSSLTMGNVPWHDEVRAFSESLASALGGEYGLAAEHRHSCCILLARKDKFLVDGQWHTWINYERFHELAAAHAAGGASFCSRDYTAPTPSWAQFGAPEAGFDPVDKRFYRKGKDPNDPNNTLGNNVSVNGSCTNDDHDNEDETGDSGCG